jgi:glyoxylase-like metal-dependent hydrolase (beta-lactamase superfamily II)
MKIIQLSVGGFDNNFSYIVVGENNEAILIDSTGSEKIIDSSIKENNLKVVMLLFTHAHPDHIELLPYYREKGIGIKYFEDLKNESTFTCAGIKIETIFAPGHTFDSVCFLIENNLFTGDTLFVKGVGTTSYGGNEKELENTLQKFFELPQDIIIWPGHDYGGKSSTLAKALANIHLRPSKETMKKIHEKVKEYNSKNKISFDKPTV